MDAATTPLPVVRRSWAWGGAILITGVLVALVPTLLRGPFWGGGAIGAVLIGLAWLVFAYGRDRVVAGPLGVVALTVLAIWPVAAMVVWPILYDGVLEPTPPMQIAATVSGLIPVAAGVVAAVEIARGGRVPRAFRRAPLIAAGLCIVPSAAVQLLGVATGPAGQDMLIGLTAVVTLCQLIALVGLGVVAIVAALQPRAAASGAVPPSADG